MSCTSDTGREDWALRMRRQAEKQQHLLGERRMNSQKEKPTLSSQHDNHQQRPTAGNVGRSRSLEAGRPGSRRRRHHRWSSAALELERGVAPVLNGHVAHDHVRSSHVRVHVQRRQVAHAQVAPHLALARAQVAPGHVALLDHLHRVGAVHAALLQAEDVRGLAVRDLVRAEPLAHVVHHAGQQPLHVVNVVQLGGPPVLLVNADQLVGARGACACACACDRVVRWGVRPSSSLYMPSEEGGRRIANTDFGSY
uniref:Uncharacterized protein n=1 Tax=Heterosigma akashiwo TaxID=2829 RepID=A0A7S3XX89_HETAK